MSHFPKQLLLHRPDDGVYGDCHRTVVACLLGLKPLDVPHFCEGDPSYAEFRRRVATFLGPLRLTEFHVPFDAVLPDVLVTMQAANPEAYWILGGFSRTGCNHSVLCRGGEIVHDPSLTNAGIVGPMSDGYFWASVLAMQPKPVVA